MSQSNKSIMDIVHERGIKEIVHFTSNHGMVGSLAKGSVLSRRALPKEEHLSYISAPTAATRMEAEKEFDKDNDWLDYINLSISEINTHYFGYASKKWHINGDRWWVILSFSPDILCHEGVYFTTTNNTYIEHVKRLSGPSGFEQLFDSVIKRKGTWCAYRRSRPAHLPTCEQAEVLYPSALSLDHLRKVYVQNEDDHDRVGGWLLSYKMPEVEVVIDNEKFAGKPN